VVLGVQPGAVRAEQAEHLAAGHLEVDALDRLDATRVGLAELMDLDRGTHDVPSSPLGSSAGERLKEVWRC
jgi:hypothetical protein